MEEDKFSELFAGFDPEMSSDNIFMSRMQERLEAVELVKQQIAEAHRRSKLAVIAAAVAGFVFGVIAAIFYPMVSAYISAHIASGYTTALLLAAICVCGFTVSYAAYDLTLAATAKRELFV